MNVKNIEKEGSKAKITLEIERDLMDACVIRFNTPPYTIPERGCAIFFHCSKGATGGCIGLPETDMVNTLLWMDTRLNPYILITGYQKEVN